MTLLQIVLLSLTMLAISAGQVLFKLAADRITGSGPLWSEWLLNPYLAVALVVYGLATLSWIALLRQLPLSLAYPFAALAFFMVPLLGHWWLGEALRWQTLVGAGFILAGVWISVGLR